MSNELPPDLAARLRSLFETTDPERDTLLERLLREHPEHAEAMRARIARARLELDALTERRPDAIGPYRVLDLLGEGGMGEVYLAEQTAPVQRRVALKVIKRGMGTARILRRFQAEQSALARFNHDGIARIFDAGDSEGRPYIAMELVSGEPITEFCDRRRLPVEDRIGLLEKVCAGVQHAHDHGVVHRDLKPSNVLAADGDGAATVKIIDFGVAKAMGLQADPMTQTEVGARIGTPEYMSPEQAAGSSDIDGRTDVYALGMLLHELLVGGVPARPGPEAAAPTCPSQRIATSGDATSALAARRRTTPRALRRRLVGDLDCIVLKAIARDRERRYRTPGDLAADLRRHLCLRARKLVRRHGRWFVVAGLALASFVAARLLPGDDTEVAHRAAITQPLHGATGALALAPARSWEEQEPTHRPPPRKNHAMAHDVDQKVTVLFGGERDGLLGDTWIWDGRDWLEVTPAVSPSPRAEHAMVYDRKRQVIILFGGVDSSTATLHDTWEWNGAARTWTNVSPELSPDGRVHHAMAYDATTGLVVLFGGATSAAGGSSRRQDTWEWNGSARQWTQRRTDTAPPSRWRHAMAYDPAHQAVVLCGGDTWPGGVSGFMGDVWVWHHRQGTWECISEGWMPGGRALHEVTLDERRGWLLLFGGSSGDVLYGDTWERLPSGWARVPVDRFPSPRNCHTMVYDSANDCMVLFGGTVSGDRLDGETWVCRMR